MKITKRWVGVFEQEYMEDLIELDNKYYRVIDQGWTNYEIEDHFKSGYLKDKYTIGDLKSGKEAGNAFAAEILEVIFNSNPDHSNDFVCCCGGEKLGISHSDYCPKSNNNWK